MKEPPLADVQPAISQSLDQLLSKSDKTQEKNDFLTL